MTVLALAVILQMAKDPACSFPGMVPQFWPVVLRGESRFGGGFSPFALHDDTANRSYYPDTADEAEAKARRLLNQGHSVGLGLSQLTARGVAGFQRKFGLTIRQALDACTNMRSGAEFFVRGALSTYNAGRPTAAPGYAARVIAALSIPPDSPVPQPPDGQDQADASSRPASGIDGETFFNGD